MKNYICSPLKTMAISIVLLCSSVYADSTRVVAKVGDKVISIAQFEERARELKKSGYAHVKVLDLAGKRELLDGIVARELLALEGIRRGYDRDSLVAETVQKTKRRLIIKELYNRKALQQDYPFTEEQLREFFVERNYDREVLAQHIVCKTESEAQEVLAKLEQGVAFAELVSEYSVRQIQDRFGPNGWVGWFKIGEVYEELKEPLSTMAHGQLYPEPVETHIGYHVFRLKARRPVDFEAAREWVGQQLRVQLRANDMERYIETLRQRYRLVAAPDAFSRLLAVPSGQAWQGKDKTLLTWRGGKLTARGYMERVGQGLAVHPAALDSAGLHKAVDNLAGRQIMMAEARELGIDEEQQIRDQVEAERNVFLVKMLYQVETKKRTRQFSEEEVRSFYDQNLAEFTRSDGKVTEFSFIKKSIHSMLRERALSASMDSFIAELRASHEGQIEIYTDVLDLALRE